MILAIYSYWLSASGGLIPSYRGALKLRDLPIKLCCSVHKIYLLAMLKTMHKNKICYTLFAITIHIQKMYE